MEQSFNMFFLCVKVWVQRAANDFIMIESWGRFDFKAKYLDELFIIYAIQKIHKSMPKFTEKLKMYPPYF